MSSQDTSTRNRSCRICKSEHLLEFLKLGSMPLANGFLKPEHINDEEPSFPLDMHYCTNCGLVQLLDIVQKESLFKYYVYYSSISKAFSNHCAQMAEEIVERFANSTNSLVVEIGSNDGVFLKQLRKHSVRLVGVEPASNLAETARAEGLETINDFFSEEVALKLVKSKGNASVIISTNTISHINDLEGLMRGIDILLNEKGVFILEDPYFVDVIENNEYDQIYHEHLSYFSVRPLVHLFGQFGMEIFDIKREPEIHGGSIRVYVRRRVSDSTLPEAVGKHLALEKSMRLDQQERYLEFASKANLAKDELSDLLKKLKGEGKRIVGYGASSKGNVILNFCNIGPETLDYIADATPSKQGLYTPGKHIPVLAEEKFQEDYPDYAVLFAWNFADEILQKQRQYREGGGKFILPVPTPRILS